MNISGKSITIQNGVVTVDGVVVDMKGTSNITINQCDYLKTDTMNVVVNGDVSALSTQSGDVEVRGDVIRVQTLSGDVTVYGSVTGDISTMSGDVNVSKV
jgi:DUF4097 and DUF4098 domain-containing protein YvlB